jgi:hypothetical protein
VVNNLVEEPTASVFIGEFFWGEGGGIRRWGQGFNHLNAKLNPICHLLALLGAHNILHVSRIRVNTLFVF